MNELDRRLQFAIATNADPRVVSPEGTAYAWRPVRAGMVRQDRDRIGG
jgi:hypothetical protein